MAGAARELLSVQGLSIDFRTRSGTVHALEGVGFSVAEGEMTGIVGESGSGKSVTASAIMGLLEPSAHVLSGQILLEGRDLRGMSEAELQRLRGTRIGMVFQNPRAALNPIRTIGRQLQDVLLAHAIVADRKQAGERAAELLAQVRIPDPERRMAAYPAELSGGMCQRVMIALALAGSPRLLVADEPTTGLDVTTQASITRLVRDLGIQRGMGTILITHDMALAAECCDRLVVMHAGHVVERAATGELIERPRHPYTRRLLSTIPDTVDSLEDLRPIRGNIPDLRGRLPACRFSARCEHYDSECDTAPLATSIDEAGHFVACRKPIR